jgi:hypothetical protein
VSELPDGTKERRQVADIRALDARLSGASYSVIQRMNDYKTRTDAQGAVRRALQKHHVEPLQDRIVIVLARYERMLLALWPAAMKGDVASIREARAITDSVVKLEGLAQPERFELTWPAIEADTRQKARDAGLGPEDEESAVEFVRTHLAL